jgi:hypothetical protein
MEYPLFARVISQTSRCLEIQGLIYSAWSIVFTIATKSLEVIAIHMGIIGVSFSYFQLPFIHSLLRLLLNFNQAFEFMNYMAANMVGNSSRPRTQSPVSQHCNTNNHSLDSPALQ